MVKLKTIPEDFVVLENYSPNFNEDGNYSIFLLEKKDYSTMKVIKIISDILGVKITNIGYSGIKDKVAITKQYISVKSLNNNMRKDYSLSGLKLSYLGQSNDVISLGTHSSNTFIITLRDIEIFSKVNGFFLNYFDEQRFSKNNVETGLFLLKGKFKNAIKNILEFYSDDSDIEDKINSGDYENIKHDNTEIPKKIIDFLKGHKNEFVGALKIIPKKFLQIYIKSFQSYLFNKILSDYIGENSNKIIISGEEYNFIDDNFNKYLNINIPLIGFSTELNDDEISNIAKRIMQNYGISFRDFILRSLPELSEEGELRSIVSEAKNLKIGELEEDDLNSNKKKLQVSFELQPGSYATIFIKQKFF